MEHRDLYLKRTTRNGKKVITHHRVWDADHFLNSQQEQARKDSAKNPAEAYLITVATEAEYKAGKGN
jgi:hypothetical protein